MSTGPWSKTDIQNMTDMAKLKHIEKHYAAESRSCAKMARKVKDPAPGQIERLQKDAREWQSLSVEASRRIAILKAKQT